MSLVKCNDASSWCFLELNAIETTLYFTCPLNLPIHVCLCAFKSTWAKELTFSPLSILMFPSVTHYFGNSIFLKSIPVLLEKCNIQKCFQILFLSVCNAQLTMTKLVVASEEINTYIFKLYENVLIRKFCSKQNWLKKHQKPHLAETNQTDQHFAKMQTNWRLQTATKSANPSIKVKHKTTKNLHVRCHSIV